MERREVKTDGGWVVCILSQEIMPAQVILGQFNEVGLREGWTIGEDLGVKMVT